MNRPCRPQTPITGAAPETISSPLSNLSATPLLESTLYIAADNRHSDNNIEGNKEDEDDNNRSEEESEDESKDESEESDRESERDADNEFDESVNDR